MFRRHGSKPTLALWMLVALADIAILVAAAGVMTVLLVATGAMLVAGAFAGVRQLQRRAAPQPSSALRRRA
ncbi:hypothetical protein [Couchioplanes azureus]|uniref:hypothetical protein n=1 Tax=Couchioplanes caeruleus TaxID=56438 RepID=UPI001670EFE9|nr:hypothetical protein [Couchioplanes caeruleus]GGQ41208.1 hypothetical protein GCM10010166_05720 [Couchioplanes caeruleus subsp. azureus]